ncbi:hypothetical protein MLD38_035238 [Melastoma candidum]|uniref:Uncharacterized protein n=1 Tax=Melastoma candidum TaxID=119954 RepID=A0ACB9ME34_9MYRT|nr:hypothetical protein MLD38_035238 [Melastoma candidum]
MGKNHGIFGFADKVDKVLMVLGTLGSIGDGMQYPLTMFIISQVINEYGQAGSSVSMETVNKYSLRLLYVAIAVGLSAFVEGLCWARTAERQTSRMRMTYLKSVLRQEVGFFDTQEAGSSTTYKVISTISADANTIQVAICEKIPDCLAYVSTFFFCLLVALLLSWKLALAALPFSFMFVFPALVFGKLMMDIGGKMVKSYTVAGGIAEQAISSIRTVYSYVGESQTLQKFSNALQNTMELGIRLGFAKGLMMGCMGIIYVGWAFQAWVGTILVSEKGEKGGHVFVSGICMIMGGICVLSSLPNLTTITEAKAAATRISEMIDRDPAIDAEDRKGKALSYVRGEVEFRDVYFNYPSRPDTPILQGLNFRAPAGKTVGLVGGSGSGKSTIIALIQRFYDPIEGEVILDGHKIKKLQLKWLRSQMGLVNQEPVLFATSIRENILFGKEGASMEEVMTAAKAANAHDFISKLPDGYDTNVGQFGFQLSGGQKQRIAIARALIRDPKILLLDEATSALDAQSEKIIQDTIEKASVGRTTIIIAHRLSTICGAKRIVVLQAGKVIESGSHEELIQKDGEYRKMVQLQQMTAENGDNSLGTPIYQNPGRTPHRSSAVPSSPVSIRVSAQSTPSAALSPLSPGLSFSAPYSYTIQNDTDESFGEDFEETDLPHPSQWRLMKLNAPEWKRALLGCLGAIGAGAIQPVNAYTVGALISNYFRTDKSIMKAKSREYSFIFLGLAGVLFCSSLIQHYSFSVMGEKLTKRVREKMLEKIMSFEVGWFDQDENTSAALCARIATEASTVRSLVGDRMSLLVQAIFGATFAYALGLVLTWRLTLALIAVQPLVIGSFYARSVLMKSMAGKAQKAQKEGSQLASEAVTNHRTITAFSSQKRILGLFRATLDGPRKESIKQSWFAGVGLFSSQFFNSATAALAYWYGGKLLSQDKITPEHLYQSFLILVFTAYIIAEAGSMTSDIAKGTNSVRSLFSILDRRSEIEPDSAWGRDLRKSIRGQVELKNVFFAYPARPEQMIFQGLSLKVRAGKTVALVGPSGSGKSTIIGLIERFYDPIKGSVLIDDQDIQNYNLRSLRSQIALVSQEPALFAGTIRENIAYGREDATESEIRQAATLANAHEFISGMKDGYNTYCGERGVQISGGQKQRIALARAMLKDPSILLLDEATSALDSISESLVQEALEKMMIDRTCIVIAHRLSTIQKSDSIAVIKNGKVAEQGSHNELVSLGRSGAYNALIKLQNGRGSLYR